MDWVVHRRFHGWVEGPEAIRIGTLLLHFGPFLRRPVFGSVGFEDAGIPECVDDG